MSLLLFFFLVNHRTKKIMETSTNCCSDLLERIKGCIGVAIVTKEKEVIASSGEIPEGYLSMVVVKEHVFDTISTFGRGKHFSTTIVDESYSTVIAPINKNTYLIVMLHSSDSLGIVYSLLPSVVASLS